MTKDEILERVKFHAELKGLSKNTQDEYYTKAKAFQNYYDKPATELGISDIQNYLYYLHKEKHMASGSINSYNSGIRFLYNTVLDVPLNPSKIPCRKLKKHFPDILTRDEVKLLLDSCSNLRDKAILTTMYSAGLRLSEAAKLKVSDIDSKNMQILIQDGKGGKDRFAILSETNLKILREYWKQYRPSEWLFMSMSHRISDTHLSARGIQNIFKSAKDKSGIKKNITTHSLRHSFATHLLEDGVSIFYIKQLLGHSNIRSTCVYLHLVKISELNIVSPIDKIMGAGKNA